MFCILCLIFCFMLSKNMSYEENIENQKKR